MGKSRKTHSQAPCVLICVACRQFEGKWGAVIDSPLDRLYVRDSATVYFTWRVPFPGISTHVLEHFEAPVMMRATACRLIAHVWTVLFSCLGLSQFGTPSAFPVCLDTAYPLIVVRGDHNDLPAGNSGYIFKYRVICLSFRERKCAVDSRQDDTGDNIDSGIAMKCSGSSRSLHTG